MISFSLLGWFFLTKIYFFSPFLVDGPSMMPNLESGELFIIDEGDYLKEEPQRGDIVVFSFEDKPDYFYVKRVVGLPGEKVTLNREGVFIQKNDDQAVKLDESYLTNIDESVRQEYMYKPKVAKKFKVPDEKYFVLGDNRNHSFDSRSFKDPYVPKNRIKGKYLVTLFHI
jgi:signal peptidase I